MQNAEDKDIEFMRQALMLARRAGEMGEVPVGAVLTQAGELVAEGWNQPIVSHDPSAHAEMIALRAGARTLSNYRLPGTCLYVTLEPCAMCLGAILHARVERLVFGASDPKTGALGGAFSLLELSHHNHYPAVIGGVLAGDCGELLKAFFHARR